MLLALARQSKVVPLRRAMFTGKKINVSENRAVLHTALRASESQKIFCNGRNVMPSVLKARRAMLAFAALCRRGAKTGAGGPVSDVVNIGIGGSDLGPAMATEALCPFHDGPRLHFVSNMDGAHLADTLRGLSPKKTLVIVSSKTFTTAETMENAARAKSWLDKGAGKAAASKRLVAVTASPAAARAFGAESIFDYPEWVGGRYSVWGPVGLPLALAIGGRRFLDFLEGGRAMDEHFRNAPPKKNLPVLLGLCGVWHRNVCNMPSRAVLPYAQRLRLLPAYLQQLDMESNGKSVMRNDAKCPNDTAPIVWGSAGTNAQHAYFQMLHQGTHVVPCEFIAFAQGFEKDGAQQEMLAANCIAQSAALMLGDCSRELPPYRRFPGGRPSITLLCRRLTPYVLGQIIALYEHRALVEGAIWGVNSFDQWGVELGKTLARQVRAAMDEGDPGANAEHDSSTRGLIRNFRRMQEEKSI